MGLSDFGKGLGDAVSNVGKVAAYTMNPTHYDDIVRGAGKAAQFAIKNPEVIGKIGKEIIKEELKPQNLLINAALIGATVATGGAAAPAALAARGAMAARAAKTGVTASRATRIGLRAAKTAETAEDVISGTRTAGRIAKGIDKVNDARRWASPVERGAHGLRTGLGEKVLEGGTGPVRQMVANAVQGTGTIGRTTRMVGQSDAAYKAQQTARQIRNVRRGVNVARNTPEAVSAAADPTGYAMKKALGSGSGGGPTGETYETLPGGQAAPSGRKAGMRQGALEGIRTDLNTPNAPGATLPSLSQPGQPPGGPPNPPPTTSPGPANPPTPQRAAAVIPSRATPGVTGNIGVSANGVLTPTQGRQATFQQNAQQRKGGGAANRMHAWQGANREGLGGIDVDYDWRRFQKRASQPWGAYPRGGRAAQGGEEGEEGSEDESWRTTPPPTQAASVGAKPLVSPPSKSMSATASPLYQRPAETTPGPRMIGTGGRNDTFYKSGQTTEQADITMGGTLAWGAKGQGSFAFPELTQPSTKQPEPATSVGTTKPVNPVNPARIAQPGQATPPGVIGSSPSMSPWRQASQAEIDEGIKPSEGFWVRPSKGEDSAGSVMTNKPMRPLGTQPMNRGLVPQRKKVG